MNGHIIEAKELSYIYPDGTRGIDKISFKVAPGEAAALVGENGAGKSTLLQHLNGCLFPTGGAVHVAGLPVIKENLPAVRRAAGMIFQNPDDQLFMPTVFEDVAFGLRNLGVDEGELEGKVLKALETVGIAHLRGRQPYRLSQGEKRAAAIASVVALEPDILVMDEPTSNLDPKARRRLIRLLKTFDHAKIIATHDLDFALEVCGRTIVMHEGAIAADGPTTEVFLDAALLERCNLETPSSLAPRRDCGAVK